MSKSAAPAELARELEAAQKRIAELERALKKGGQRPFIALEPGGPGPRGGNLNTGEQVLDLFIEYAPAAIAIFDRGMRYIAASRRYLADYRLSGQDVVGRSHYDIFPEIPERWKEIHRRCLAGAIERAEADPFPRGDGTLDWVRWEIRPWFKSGGEVGGIILFSEVITEREQAEDRYRKLIERLDLATRSARMGIWDWDIQKNELVWDDQMYTLYGLETGGFGGAYEAWLHGVHPEDRAASDEVSARARRGEAEYDTEFRVVWPDGSVHWLKANGEVFRDEAGVPIRMIGVNYDISERKRAEESLRQSEARYRLISENAADVIWVLDPASGKFTYVSPSVEKLRGYAPEEVMTQPVEAALTPESLEQVRESLAVNIPAFLAKGSGTESFISEVDQPRRDGSIVHTEVTTTYLFNERGQVEIVGVSRDITARKLLETRLTESERRYNLLFQKSTTPVVLLKMPEVVIADINEAAEKLSGFTRQEMLGRTAAELGIISREQRREAVAQYEQENRLTEHERKIFTKSGEERIVIANTNPLEIGGQFYAITSMQDITERTKMEQELRRSEALLAEAQRIGRIGHIEWMGRGDELTCSDEMYDILELPHGSALTQRTIAAMLSPADLARLHTLDMQAFARRGDLDYEYRIHLADGRERWLHQHGKVAYDPDGRPVRMMAICQDITARKQIEENLRRRTEELEQLLDLLPAAVWIANDPQCKIIHGNQYANDLLGVSAEANISQSAAAPSVALRQYAHGRELSPDELPMQTAARTGQPQLDIELRIEKGAGISHTLLGGAVPLFDESGKTRGVVAAFHDITGRKKAEERFSKAFHANPVGMNLIDLENGVIVDVNDAYLSIFGMKREEVVGRTSVEAGLVIHPQERLRFLSTLKENGKLPQNETEYRRRDGEKGHIIVSAEVIELENKPYGLVSTSDITERKHMEDELRRSNAELEQFAYVASHDLQEPLRAVAGMVQLLQRKYKDQLDERANEYIEHAVEAASRMQGLINDLLSFSRVERRGRDFKSVAAEQCVQTALKNLEVAVRESGASVTWDQLPTVNADETQLTQLFQNLIGNGIKFHGQAAPRVHISAAQTDNGWQFSVRDNGIGIDPQYFERIFLVFQRLHTRREYAGTGIGLALCRKIIERHGGQIWVESQPGLGSTFHFTLPQRNNHVLSF